jgi:hypothetical protein
LMKPTIFLAIYWLLERVQAPATVDKLLAG